MQTLPDVKQIRQLTVRAAANFDTSVSLNTHKKSELLFNTELHSRNCNSSTSDMDNIVHILPVI